MKKTIYKYFFNEFIRYFLTTLFALSVIVWTVQTVNYLDLVTDDGHSFRVFFLYSILTLSKILTKLIPFCFLISTVLTILKLEKDNELIALWTSGLNKIYIVNFIFRVSLLVMFLQLLLTTTVNPKLLNFSRALLKNSELQFIPSLLKQKQFNDTIESLTIFVEDKNDQGVYKNIFIRDEGKILSDISEASSTIVAKSGYLSDDEKNLVLLNGSMQKTGIDGSTNIIKFEKTTLSFYGLGTKSVSVPKIQETSTIQILRCIKSQNADVENCSQDKKTPIDTKIEINKRFGMPIFIPLIALVCCFLLGSRGDKKNYYLNKYIYFFISLIILVIAEILVRYSGVSWNYTIIYYLMPILASPIFYLMLIRTFKYENLS